MHLIRRDDNSSHNSNTNYRRIIRLTQTNYASETNLIRVVEFNRVFRRSCVEYNWSN